MFNIGLIEIVMAIALTAAIHFFLKEIKREDYLGKLIFKIPRDKKTNALVFFWVMMGFFWIYLSLNSFLSSDGNYYTSPVIMITTPILWLLISMLNVYRTLNSKEIREKGMTTVDGFLYWENIVQYRWIKSSGINGAVLEVFYTPRKRIFPNRKIRKLITMNEENIPQIEKKLKKF